eukprot:scaffold415857_cov16-Prasinocladus_malaysianus.AAC.1
MSRDAIDSLTLSQFWMHMYYKSGHTLSQFRFFCDRWPNLMDVNKWSISSAYTTSACFENKYIAFKA